ncbi:SRPBCC domain-containing protein [Mycobacterium sp.]|uniref:SRPBCC domain-containing protein n=1 Tax=Mycobacterium sp. TaxID=1785 RepID=UPI003F80D10D
MKIANQFTVSAPIDDAWGVLCDPEQVIPLMPGAQLTGHEGDDYLGKVKVKVGPVTSEFSGKVRFVEQDSDRHRAVIDAKGKESRGTGNAAATVTAQLHQDGERTNVTVDTDLKIVGKLAQFGSGMLQQVSEKLLGQFVESLEAKLASEKTSDETAPLASPATPTSPATPQSAATRVTRAASGSPMAAAATPDASPAPEPEPIDLLALAGGGQLKKYSAVALAVCAALALIWLLRQRR